MRLHSIQLSKRVVVQYVLPSAVLCIIFLPAIGRAILYYGLSIGLALGIAISVTTVAVVGVTTMIFIGYVWDNLVPLRSVDERSGRWHPSSPIETQDEPGRAPLADHEPGCDGNHPWRRACSTDRT